ncbi:hypothetical protein [Actinoplanes sp. NPDC051494]|uniref:hypothetical protein n=1 Tax=Actinoplanes sp. NPDC051494 TaxID=3363907 RepID=UPI00378AB80E
MTAISSVGAGAMFAFRVATGAATPSAPAEQTQVSAQADLLQQLMGSRLPAVAAAQLSNSTGVDLYL